MFSRTAVKAAGDGCQLGNQSVILLRSVRFPQELFIKTMIRNCTGVYPIVPMACGIASIHEK